MRCDEIEKLSVNNANIHRFTYLEYFQKKYPSKNPPFPKLQSCSLSRFLRKW